MPDPVIRTYAILPEQMDKTVLQKAFRDAVRKESKKHKELFLRVSKTWKQKDVPHWKVTTKVLKNSIVGECTTNSTPMVYLELGTKTRKRRMQRGYGKRTKSRFLGSFAGAKEADGWYTTPVPGIKAGDWRFEIADVREIPFILSVARATVVGSAKLFKTGKGIVSK